MNALPLLRLVVALTGTGYAQHALQQAERLFESPDDARAKAAFLALLANAPPIEIEAKAHVYLGLLALNAADKDGAKLELEKALRLDAKVELPPSQSPEAKLLFADAQKALEPPPPSPAPPAVTPVPAAAEATADEAPSHLPAYLVGGAGAAALVLGGVLGILQQQVKSTVVKDSTLAAAHDDAQAYAPDGVGADVCFTIGGAALVAAVVLYFLEGSGKTPAVSVAAGPSGFALSGAF